MKPRTVSPQIYYNTLQVQPPYRGLLSSSCGGLQPSAAPEKPLGPKANFAGQTDGRKTEQTSGRADGCTDRRADGRTDLKPTGYV